MGKLLAVDLLRAELVELRAALQRERQARAAEQAQASKLVLFVSAIATRAGGALEATAEDIQAGIEACLMRFRLEQIGRADDAQKIDLRLRTVPTTPEEVAKLRAPAPSAIVSQAVVNAAKGPRLVLP